MQLEFIDEIMWKGDINFFLKMFGNLYAMISYIVIGWFFNVGP